MKKLVGFGTFKNCVSLGYPFIEAILSVLPICSRIYLSDGGSEDTTKVHLARLQAMYPDKIQLVEIPPWGGKNCEKQFDRALNILLDRINHSHDEDTWLIEIQGDELYHEHDLFPLSSQVEMVSNLGYNSLRHRCWSLSTWERFDRYQYWHVRIMRNMEGLVSSEWGDCFHLEGCDTITDGFTSHCVTPEYMTNIPMYHIHRMFPENKHDADQAMATQNAAGDPKRVVIAEISKERNYMGIVVDRAKVLKNLPALVERLWDMPRYMVREELFDKIHLMNITGLRGYTL